MVVHQPAPVGPVVGAPVLSSDLAQQQGEQQTAAAAAVQDSALSSQAAVAAARGATTDLGGHVVLVAAYCRRLQRLASLLQQYDCHLQHSLAALGLASSGQPSGVAATVAAEELAASLRQLEKQLAAAALGSASRNSRDSEALTPEALLQLGQGLGPAPAHLAAAGAPAVLAALQGAVLEDLTAVNAWPAMEPASSAAEGGAAGTAPSPLSAAFGQLQQEQRARWEAQAQRAQQLERLRDEVAAAREALAAAATAGIPDSQSSPRVAEAAAAAATRTQLAAQQAGLRAELQCLERARLAASEQGAAASAQAAQVRSQVAGLAALEQEEARVDGAVKALCAADSQVMRQWRQGTWRAQEAVEAGIAAQRQPLVQLGQQLLEAQRAELAAFRVAAAARAQAQPGARGKAAGEGPRQPATAAAAAVAESTGAGVEGAGASARTSAMRAAAQLLDPAAHLKTDEHASGVLAAAADELQQLEPVAQRWAALAASSAGQLAALRAAAGELEGQVCALHGEKGTAGALARLREAAAAAEEAVGLVGRTRQALSEWWTSPAVTAAPWVKREGKSAEEWLRLLGDQQRMLRQRESFTSQDHSNSLLSRQLR